MKSERSPQPLALPKASWLTILLMVLVTLGVCFRFAHLDSKVYWHDEAYTSLHLSGYAMQDVEQALFTGQPLAIADVQRFQRLSPGRGVADTVALLATYDAQHPPLYYVLARLWTGVAGDSVVSIRAVSALLALLVLPFAYWLGWELWQSSTEAALFMDLVAISPFHILYAQEAREYGLWTAMVLFSGAALLRALRRPSPRTWAVYALSLTLGLYTFLFTILVMVAHGLYVVAMQGLRWNRLLWHYLLATVVSGVLIAPWLSQVVTNASRVVESTAWLGESRSLKWLVQSWIVEPGRILVDFDLGAGDSLLLSLPIVLSLAGLIVYCLVFLVRKAPVSVWAFVVLLGGVTALTLVASDVLLGGYRSSISRYLTPTWLSLQLAVAHWMGAVLTSANGSGRRWQKGAIALLLLAAVLSNGVILRADAWWIKYSSRHHLAIAAIVNRSPHPLLVSSNTGINRGELLSLSHALVDRVTLVLGREPQVPTIPEGYSDLFLFNPSPNLQETLNNRGYVINVVHAPGGLWQATRPRT